MALDDKLFAIGGKGSDGTIEVYEESETDGAGSSNWMIMGENVKLKHKDNEYTAVVVDIQ